MATGALLPREWTSPVVESVVLPAHGQTTSDDKVVRVGNFGAAAATSAGLNAPSILDLVVPKAHAGGSASVGNITFDAYWTVRKDDAEICGWADYDGGSDNIGGNVGRSGDSLSTFTQKIFGQTLSFTNQKVGNGGVSLTANWLDNSEPLLAPPGIGCSELNTTSFQNSSSPYDDDEELA